MAEYIKITLSNDVRCKVNWGLRRIICFIGNPDNEAELNYYDKNCYEKGIAIINRRLHGTCKNAIRKMTRAVNAGEVPEEKCKWEFHRRKVVKALRAIENELDKLQTAGEKAALFQDIYVYLYKVFQGDVRHTKSEVLARAYIRDLRDKCSDVKYETDLKDIERIMTSFKEYTIAGFRGEGDD